MIGIFFAFFLGDTKLTWQSGSRKKVGKTLVQSVIYCLQGSNLFPPLPRRWFNLDCSLNKSVGKKGEIYGQGGENLICGEIIFDECFLWKQFNWAFFCGFELSGEFKIILSCKLTTNVWQFIVLLLIAKVQSPHI